MSTEYEQDLQEFIDLRARIKKLESALQEIYNLGRKDSDWDVVETLAREALEQVEQDGVIITYSCAHCGASYRRLVGQSGQHHCISCGKVIVSGAETAARGVLGEAA